MLSEYSVYPNLLVLLLFIPLAGILLLGVLGRISRKTGDAVALLTAIANAVVALRLLKAFNPADSTFQFSRNIMLVRSLGVHFAIGADGLSIWLILFTTLLMTLAIFCAQRIEENRIGYYMLLLLLEEAVLGTFVALDLVLFYIFWELMLIPNFFLLYKWGQLQNKRAGLKYAVFTGLGSMLMLVAVASFGVMGVSQGRPVSFFIGDLLGLTPSEQIQDLLLLGFLAAFFLKSAVFPFHTWLPDAHRSAPRGGSFDLTLVLPKMGLFGILRFVFLLLPDAFARNQHYLILLGVTALIYGALVAWRQTDLKRFLAYSTISHVGLAIAALGSWSEEGIKGCVFVMIGSGLSTGGLFLLVSQLEERLGIRNISELGGLARSAPRISFLFLLFVLSAIGLPMTDGFISEFFSLAGTFSTDPALGTIGCLGIVFGALYGLSVYRRVFFGGDVVPVHDLEANDLVPLLPLAALVFIVGLYPKPILTGVEQSLDLIDKVQQGEVHSDHS